LASLPVLLVVLACSRSGSIDYAAADPVADARRAFLDSGHFHVLAVKVGDSVISPWDGSALMETSYNVQVAPEGGVVFLALDPSPDRPDRPSEHQLAYISRYNTTLFALLDTNAMPPLPATRVKAPARRS
jgi:hypothetical protein